MEGDPRARLGRDAEDLAERHLARRGYRTLARRFRLRNGEIDLVMADGETVVFVEVRCRRAGRGPTPEESITALKQARLVRAARVFLARRGLHDRPCRFDVVAVLETGAGSVIRHLVDAFRDDG